MSRPALAIATMLALLPTAPAGGAASDADTVRDIERRPGRWESWGGGGGPPSRDLMADDFQLISPFGGTLTREAYLGGLASGAFRYQLWEPGPIAVRAHGAAAVVRYRARAVVAVRGKAEPERVYWHTDYYERRKGRWQVVWSQATEVASPSQR
jgi:hypothetical protein